MDVIFAASMLLLVGAALWIQARQYDEILRKLNSFQQLGVKVSMDPPAEDKQELKTGMTFTQKRNALETKARQRAIEKLKERQKK